MLAFAFFLLFSFSWNGDCEDIFSYEAKHKEIFSILNSVGQIPCLIDSLHDVAMILWFKDSSSSPIYSYDCRNEEEEPRHLTLKNEAGNRLYFRVWPNLPKKNWRYPALMIQELQTSDEGTYRCRVDYRNSPTTNHFVLLKIIVPPSYLEIRDTSTSRPIADQQMFPGQNNHPNLNEISYLGPYQESQNVTVVCTAHGGKPPPDVFWYRNGILLDWTYEVLENNYATNELTITNLWRNHTYDLYTCQASNNNETKAISHRVNLDVYLTPKHIEMDIPDSLTAGVPTTIRCRTIGAYPTVRVEFWKHQKRVGPRYQIKSDPDVVADFALPFRPDVGDEEAILACKAENPWITDKPIQIRRKLKIKYAPVSFLRFGVNRTVNFSEGESVLLECHVKANPAPNVIRWFRGRTEIANAEKEGITIHGKTLFFKQVDFTSVGNYSCEAENSVGKGKSNDLQLIINISPKCREKGSSEIFLSIGETSFLSCVVFAWPSDLNFYWTLNRSNDFSPLPSPSSILQSKIQPSLQDDSQRNLSSNNGNLNFRGKSDHFRLSDSKSDLITHHFLFPYTVESEEDFGTVGCSAKNSYGQQIFPCIFHIFHRSGAEGEFESHGIGMSNLTRREEEERSQTSGEMEEENFQGTLAISFIGLLVFIAIVAVVCSYTFAVYNRRNSFSSSLSGERRESSKRLSGGSFNNLPTDDFRCFHDGQLERERDSEVFIDINEEAL